MRTTSLAALLLCTAASVPAADADLLAEHALDVNATEHAPIDTVVVYHRGGAMPTRTFEFTAEAAGMWSVSLDELTSSLVSDSVRVSLLDAGNATILEVSTESKTRTETPAEDEDGAAADAKKDADLEDERLRVEAEEARVLVDHSQRRANLIDEARKVLETYAHALASSPRTESSSVSTDPSVMSTGFDLYFQRVTELDKQAADVQREHTVLAAALAKRTAAVEARKMAQQQAERDRPYKQRPRALLTQTVRVKLLVPTAGARVSLAVSYQVTGANWDTSYDARAETASACAAGGDGVGDGAGASDGGHKSSLQLHYHALVSNGSGEDWVRARLVLSTVQPGRASEPGKLGALELSLAPTEAPTRERAKGEDATRARDIPAPSPPPAPPGTPPPPSPPPAPPRPPPPPKATVSQADVGAARFEVAHRSTIRAGDVASRVTIAVLAFAPTLVHIASPSLDARAFLRASANNTSPFPLLPSESCSVYVDGSFVGKVALSKTMPGQKLELSLGHDPQVTVDWIPQPTVEGSHRDVWQKLKRESTSLAAVVRNTVATRAATLIVTLPFPRATVEEVKVRLVEPAAAAVTRAGADDVGLVARLAELEAQAAAEDGCPGAQSARATKVVSIVEEHDTGNLAWVIQLPPLAEHAVQLSYRVEHPTDQRIIASKR